MKGTNRRYIIESDSDSDSDEFEDDDCNEMASSPVKILNSEESQLGDDDNVDKLSKSLNKVKLNDDDNGDDGSDIDDDSDDDDNKNDIDDDDVDVDSFDPNDRKISSSTVREIGKQYRRKPPPGGKNRQLEDLSWSSSDDESDGSDSTVCSLRKDGRKTSPIKPIRSIKKSDNFTGVGSSSSSYPNANSSMIKSNDVIKKAKSNTLYGRNNKPTSKKYASSLVKRTYSSDSSLSSSSSSSSDDECPLIAPKKCSKKKNFLWSFNKNRKEYTIGGNDKMPAFSIPSDLFDKLYDFQKEGVAWMAGLYVGKIGGVLADDMGMGKTYMTLSLLGGLMKAKTIQKVLIVAPVSVLRNWANEAIKILRNCINLKINIEVIASDVSIQKRKKKLHQALEAQIPQLIITTFGLVSNNPDHFTQRVAGNGVWDYVVLDEAVSI